MEAEDRSEVIRRLDAIENRILGVEILLSETVLYAHDCARQDVQFNKDGLSDRLVALIQNRLPKLYPDEEIRNELLAPVARLAISLRQAVLLDKDGNPVVGDANAD